MLKDGSQTVTSNIPMSSFKFTGLAAGTASGDSLRYEQSFTSQTLTDAATISWGITAPQATVTITADRTMAAPTNQANGARYTLLVTQDGTGGRKLTWNAVFKGVNGGTMPQPETTAAAVTIFEFYSDGTNMYNTECMPFIDSNYIVRGSSDPTKKLRIEVDGLTTATTRVITMPDADVTIGLGAATGVAQTFLAGDIALNNTSNYFDVCNTGSIGASGQKWKISATVCLVDTAGSANFLIRIWDSSTVYVETQCSTATANYFSTCTVTAIVTLSGAATFQLSCKDLTNATGVAKTTASAGTANKATWIVAERMV